jgi:chromosome segregation ATPase
LKYFCNQSRKGIALLGNYNCLNSLSPKRIKELENNEIEAITTKKTLEDFKLTHESEISKLNAELLSVQKQLKEAQDNIKESKDDYELHISEYESKIKINLSLIETYKKQITELTKYQETSKEEIQRYTSEITKITNENNTFNEQTINIKNVYDIKISNMTTEINNLNITIKSITTKYTELQSTHESKVKELELRITQLEKEQIEIKENCNKQLEDDVKELTKQLQDSNEKLKVVETTQQTLKESYDSKIIELNNQITVITTTYNNQII